MSAPRIVFDALERRGCTPRGQEHRFTALCPAHEDRMPSLSVSEGTDGRALVHCFAGCETAAVVSALGLTVADLFEQTPFQRRGGEARQATRIPSIRRRTTEADADVVLMALRTLRPDGNAYRALDDRTWAGWCPLCGGDRLSIAEDEHDAILDPDVRPGVVVSCMDAGCDTDDVMAALAAGLRRAAA